MVRVHFGPPLLKRDWLKLQGKEIWLEASLSLLKRFMMHLENWTLKLLMQLWEGNSKGKLLIKRVINTILAKNNFYYWACIILLEKPDIWIFLLDTKVEAASKLARYFKTQIKSPAKAGFDLRGEAAKQGSQPLAVDGKLLSELRRRSS